MTDRLLIAYALMALMTVLVVGVIGWNVYHSHARTYARTRRRQMVATVARSE